VKPRVIRVLDADPDLGAAIDPTQRALAAEAAVAPMFRHPAGTWRFKPDPDPAALGILIIRGLILVRIEVSSRAHLELLGEGDVISAWVGKAPDLALPSVVTACVVSDLELALLGRRFALRAARWPEITAALTGRLIARSRRLSLQSAINAIPRVEDRLELTLWQLAYRFGKVTRDGFRLQMRLTHTQLSEIVAAQRPSVTIALTRLEGSGRLGRIGKDGWLLRGPEPPYLRPLAEQTGLLG
jgi:CRP-like cAMP-binding protein